MAAPDIRPKFPQDYRDPKQGRRRDYESQYLRRTYRDGGTVRHETLANLSGLPGEVADAIEAALKGTRLVPAQEAVTIGRPVPHGQPTPSGGVAW